MNSQILDFSCFLLCSQRSEWLLVLVLYNVQPLSYEQQLLSSSWCSKLHIICHVFICVSGLDFVFFCFVFLIYTPEPHCTFKVFDYFNVLFLTPRWKPTNKNACSPKTMHLLKMTSFMLCYMHVTCEAAASVKLFLYSSIQPLKVSVWKGFFCLVFFFPLCGRKCWCHSSLYLWFLIAWVKVCVSPAPFLVFDILFLPPDVKRHSCTPSE